MTTIEIIQSLCFKYRYMRLLQDIQQDGFDLRRGQLIQSLKYQIWKMKRMYLEAWEKRRAKGMLYQFNGRYYLAHREITYTEFTDYRKMQALRVA